MTKYGMWKSPFQLERGGAQAPLTRQPKNIGSALHVFLQSSNSHRHSIDSSSQELTCQPGFRKAFWDVLLPARHPKMFHSSVQLNIYFVSNATTLIIIIVQFTILFYFTRLIS